MHYASIEGVKKPVSRIVLGTMIISFGTPSLPRTEFPYLGKIQSFALLDAVTDMGGNAFDTAHIYGQEGASEKTLGIWMKERHNRDEVVIISKGGVEFGARGINEGDYKVTKRAIHGDIVESLKRLKTDYIDLYLLHHDGPNSPSVEPLVEELAENHRKGRIHAYGLSNWRTERIIEANNHFDRRGCAPIAVSQPQYSLAEQVNNPWGPGDVSLGGEKNKKEFDWYFHNQLPVIPYSSLARGFLSGKITKNNFVKTRGSLDRFCIKAYCHEKNFLRLERAMVLGRKKRVSVPQISIAFIYNSGLNIFPVVGTATPQEYKEITDALDIELTKEEIDWLDLKSN